MRKQNVFIKTVDQQSHGTLRLARYGQAEVHARRYAQIYLDICKHCNFSLCIDLEV